MEALTTNQLAQRIRNNIRELQRGLPEHQQAYAAKLRRRLGHAVRVKNRAILDAMNREVGIRIEAQRERMLMENLISWFKLLYDVEVPLMNGGD
jgi:hypothetical protein